VTESAKATLSLRCRALARGTGVNALHSFFQDHSF
jgi:hypothetical protein